MRYSAPPKVQDGRTPAMKARNNEKKNPQVKNRYLGHPTPQDTASGPQALGAPAPKGVAAMSRKRNKHMGSSIDDFLKEEGIFEEAQAQAVKEVVAWQLDEAMKKRKISKNRMARLLKTSRTQVDRLLDPKNDITLSSLQRAAAIVGRRVMIELV